MLEVGVDVFAQTAREASSSERRSTMSSDGRGERDSPATTDLPITMRLAEPPAPLALVRSA
jgi:hypothetical protein